LDVEVGGASSSVAGSSIVSYAGAIVKLALAPRRQVWCKAKVREVLQTLNGHRRGMASV
jgi:hypothetical protein